MFHPANVPSFPNVLPFPPPSIKCAEDKYNKFPNAASLLTLHPTMLHSLPRAPPFILHLQDVPIIIRASPSVIIDSIPQVSKTAKRPA